MNILVTGGASGLGAAITKRLCEDVNNTVFFTYNSSFEKAKAIENQWPNAKGIKVDFSSRESVHAFCNSVPSLELSVLINNAITGFLQDYFHKIDAQAFSNSFESNVLPVIQITQAFLKYARKKKSGRIITILTSALINKPSLGWSEYTANKAYLHSLAKSWAIENASFGITSNCISPSFMSTQLTSTLDDRLIEGIISSHPTKQLLKEEEVAEAVHFFVHASQQINGSNMVINAASDLV